MVFRSPNKPLSTKKLRREKHAHHLYRVAEQESRHCFLRLHIRALRLLHATIAVVIGIGTCSRWRTLWWSVVWRTIARVAGGVVAGLRHGLRSGRRASVEVTGLTTTAAVPDTIVRYCMLEWYLRMYAVCAMRRVCNLQDEQQEKKCNRNQDTGEDPAAKVTPIRATIVVSATTTMSVRRPRYMSVTLSLLCTIATIPGRALLEHRAGLWEMHLVIPSRDAGMYIWC